MTTDDEPDDDDLFDPPNPLTGVRRPKSLPRKPDFGTRLDEAVLHPDVPKIDAPVGVIVGRFQVPDLHDGHKALIKTVAARHPKVLVFIGSTPGVLLTQRNPLDYLTRRRMFEDAFPAIHVFPLSDNRSDEDWSRDLDRRISEVVGEDVVAVLYGSRDGFLNHYTGKRPKVLLEPKAKISGTEIRKAAANRIENSKDFRAGVLYAAHNRHPVSFQAVDAVLLRTAVDGDEVALIQKPGYPKDLWRFPGGFVAPSDEGLEEAARRELFEEVGMVDLTSQQPTYLGSFRVEDWRYFNEVDSILSAVFLFRYRSGMLNAGSDASNAAWIPVDELKAGRNFRIVPEHAPILNMIYAT